MSTEPHIPWELITRSFQGPLSSADADALASWRADDALNESVYQEAKTTWETVGTLDFDFQPDVPAAWDKLDQRRKNAAPPPPSKRRWLYGIAATLLLFVVVGWGIWQWTSTPEMITLTAYDTRTTHTLPDGSVVQLDRAATLEYPAAFSGSTRSVTLSGSAWFEVAKDPAHPFIVQMNSTQVEVLGTQFLVDQSEAETAVYLSEGQVAFHSAALTPDTLHAGQSLLFNQETQTIEILDSIPPFTLAWAQQELYFEDTPFEDFKSALETYFDIQIEVEGPDLGQCRINGRFKNPELADILAALKAVNGWESRTTQKGVVLSGTGC